MLGCHFGGYLHVHLFSSRNSPYSQGTFDRKRASFLNSDIWLRQEIRQERIKNTGATTRVYSIGPLPLASIRTSPEVIALSPSEYQIPPGGYIDMEKVYPSEQLTILGHSRRHCTHFKNERLDGNGIHLAVMVVLFI